VTLTTQVDDRRDVARIVNLVARFGCDYTSLCVSGHDSGASVSITLAGPDDALRRLRAQIEKLVAAT
jgi:hypothetical protein